MRKMGWAAFLTTSWMLFSTASPGDALEYRDPATGISLIYPSQWNVGENNDHRVTFGSGRSGNVHWVGCSLLVDEDYDPAFMASLVEEHSFSLLKAYWYAYRSSQYFGISNLDFAEQTIGDLDVARVTYLVRFGDVGQPDLYGRDFHEYVLKVDKFIVSIECHSIRGVYPEEDKLIEEFLALIRLPNADSALDFQPSP